MSMHAHWVRRIDVDRLLAEHTTTKTLSITPTIPLTHHLHALTHPQDWIGRIEAGLMDPVQTPSGLPHHIFASGLRGEYPP